MAEIFGIVSTGALTPEDRAAFEALAAEFPVGAGGRVERQEGQAALVGVVSHHAADPVGVASGHEPAAAWLGLPGGEAGKPPSWLAHHSGAPARWEARAPWLACLIPAARPEARVVGDPFGLSPLYWRADGARVLFASRVAPLLRASGSSWRLDRAALHDLLVYEHVTGHRTLAEEVRVLAPGAFLEIAKGRVRERRYSDGPVAPLPGQGLGNSAVAEALGVELGGAVARAVDGVDRVAITLSGGLDSRALLGFAADAGASLRAYTFGVPGSRDVKLAAELAAARGVPHEVLTIEPSFLPEQLEHAVDVTGGMVGAAHFHILSLVDLVAERADAVLDGLGGDAFTGAHLGWGMFATRSSARVAELVQAQRATGFADGTARNALLEPDWALPPGETADATRRHADPSAQAWWTAHRFDLLERQRRFIQFGPHLFRARIDVRTPFYDRAVVDLLLRARADALFEQRAYRCMHAACLPDLAAVDEAGRGLPVGASTARRMARRIEDGLRRRVPGGSHAPSTLPTDYPAWLRGPLRAFIEERLLDGHGPLEGIVRRAAIEQLIRDHADGRDHTARLCVLLSLSTWLRRAGRPS